MPIIYKDRHTCENCHRDFEWNYFTQPRGRSNPSVSEAEDFPNVTLVHTLSPTEEGIYSVGVNCPHCGYDNYFSFRPNQ